MRQQSISFQRVQYQLVSNETKLHVDIQHQRQQSDAKKSYYFCIAKTGVAVRALPTAGNTSALETEIAFNRLLPPAARQRPELVNLARTNQQSSWLGQEANNQADAKADQEQGKKEKGHWRECWRYITITTNRSLMISNVLSLSHQRRHQQQKVNMHSIL